MAGAALTVSRPQRGLRVAEFIAFAAQIAAGAVPAARTRVRLSSRDLTLDRRPPVGFSPGGDPRFGRELDEGRLPLQTV